MPKLLHGNVHSLCDRLKMRGGRCSFCQAVGSVLSRGSLMCRFMTAQAAEPTGNRQMLAPFDVSPFALSYQ